MWILIPLILRLFKCVSVTFWFGANLSTLSVFIVPCKFRINWAQCKFGFGNHFHNLTLVTRLLISLSKNIFQSLKESRVKIQTTATHIYSVFTFTHAVLMHAVMSFMAEWFIHLNNALLSFNCPQWHNREHISCLTEGDGETRTYFAPLKEGHLPHLLPVNL